MTRAPAHVSAFKSLAAFLRQAALSADRFDDALVLATLYGRLQWDNISGQFSDDPLEVALFDRWQHEFTAKLTPAKETDTICHVLSELYTHGGHSRLFRMLVGGLSDSGLTQHAIITERAKEEALALVPQNCPIRVLSGSASERAKAVYASAMTAQAMLLQTHPYEIGAALAARAVRRDGGRVLFLNHADHVFSFGPGTSETVLEICGTGWRTTHERRAAENQHFMGLPIARSDTAPIPLRVDRDGTILSIGSSAKYQPSDTLNFPEFLSTLLDRVPNRAVIIGPDPVKDPWWQPLIERHADRIEMPGIQPFDRIAAEFSRAACYIDSFPMDGGTIFSEALLNGVPIFGPNRDCNLGISPADKLRCVGTDQLLDDVTAYLGGGDLPAQQADVQEQICTEFTETDSVRRVLKALKGEAVPLPPVLVELSNRGPDYNAENWMSNGRLTVPKRLWKRLSVRAKLRVWRGLGAVDIDKDTRQNLRRRLIAG